MTLWCRVNGTEMLSMPYECTSYHIPPSIGKKKKQTFLCPQPRGCSLQHKQLMLTACSMAGYRALIDMQFKPHSLWLET